VVLNERRRTCSVLDKGEEFPQLRDYGLKYRVEVKKDGVHTISRGIGRF